MNGNDFASAANTGGKRLGFAGLNRIEARVRDVVTVAVLAITALLLPAAGARGAAGDADVSASKVNSSRASHGLASLKRNPALDKIALDHAKRMAAAQRIYHNENRKAEADRAGVDWVIIGENVGVGPDGAAIHKGFMNSAGHKENILYRSYNTIGVGATTGSNGSVYLAQVFARVESGSAPAPAKQSPPSSKPVSVREPAPATQVTASPSVAPAPVATPKPRPIVLPLPTPDNSADPNALVGGVVVH